jgi:hypothetical protein
MARSNQGLKRGPLDAWVQAAKSMDNPDKRMVGLLMPFTGARVDAICHIHGPTWFNWSDADSDEVKSEDGIAKLKVPDSENFCRKYDDTKPCGDCNIRDHQGFESKYDDEREIPLANTWKNWNKGGAHENYVEEELGLRDFCKSYFKVTENDYGNEMIDGNGVATSTVGDWLKEIGQVADIGYERGTVIHSTLGEVPDIKAHDMRGTLVMQLIRNNMQRTKLTKYTGHDHVESLAPYEERVAEETDDREFLDRI